MSCNLGMPLDGTWSQKQSSLSHGCEIYLYAVVLSLISLSQEVQERVIYYKSNTYSVLWFPGILLVSVYCESLEILRSEIKAKSPGHLANRVVMHYDNACPHVINVPMQRLHSLKGKHSNTRPSVLNYLSTRFSWLRFLVNIFERPTVLVGSRSATGSFEFFPALERWVLPKRYYQPVEVVGWLPKWSRWFCMAGIPNLNCTF